MKCLCCHNEFDEFETEYRCSFCGFTNFDTLGFALDSDAGKLIKEYRKSADYRKNLLSRTTDFSVKAYLSKWDDKRKAYDTPEAVELFDRNLFGSDFYEKTVISPVEVSQLGAGEGKALEIGYVFSGTPKKIVAHLKPVQIDKPWRVGMRIDRNLRLSVYVGDVARDQAKGSERCAVSDGIDLDLIAD